MKILITGGKGMLGRTLQKELADFDLIITDREELDITNAAESFEVIKNNKPDIVIHCAAMTNVDGCESDKDAAYRLNAVGSANIASACNANGVKLIAISTDYVFDGASLRPYNEYDNPNPKTMYGKSKYAGEQAVCSLCPDHIVLRLAWLYGEGGPSFIHTMMKLADGSRPELKIVVDQIGNPTSTTAVAKALKNLLTVKNLRGTFHLTCEGEASWYDLAHELFAIKGIDQKIVKCTTDEFPRPARRPLNSRLDKMNLRLYGLPPMPNWKDALRDFLITEKF